VTDATPTPIPAVRPPLFAALPPEVSIFEVGPRDGLQNESTVLPVERKIEMIEGLVDAGIKRIELTSFVNPRWIPALADHMEVASRVRRRPGVSYSALVPNLRGLDSATRAGMQEIAVFMAASQTHNRKNINKSTDEALATYREVVHEARARGMSVRGYVSTVYGCPYEGSISLDSVVALVVWEIELREADERAPPGPQHDQPEQRRAGEGQGEEAGAEGGVLVGHRGSRVALGAAEFRRGRRAW